MNEEASARRRKKLQVTLGLAGAVLAICGLVSTSLIDRIAERYLSGEASHTALAWADYVARNVPDVDLIFEGEVPSPLAQDHLTALRSVGDVFRFELFDPSGRRVLASESLSGEHGFAGKLQVDALAQGVARASKAQVRMTEAPEPGAKQGTLRLHSEAYVPVRQMGAVLGVVRVDVNQTDRAARVRAAFRWAALGVGALLTGLAALAVWWVRRGDRIDSEREERVRFLAHHDALTGALNRASFEADLQERCTLTADREPAFAVMCIDLDRFKEVNDSLGHAAGDEVLRQVVRRLQRLVRTGDLVARLGGDEFALLQTGVADPGDVTTLAQRVVEALGVPYELHGRTIDGGASLGIAVFRTDSRDADELLRRADMALYGVKSRGRGGFGFFDAALEKAVQQSRQLTRDLRVAVETGALALHFQPLYDADDARLSGYEALVRWPHPTRGMVPPGDFIPLAEESGMIDALGRWVLQRACAEAATWPAPLSVAVNLSAAQFRKGLRLVDEVRDALTASGLEAGRLEVEITESLLISNTAQVLECLHALHALGVRIAMDDFGTGYSSLSYLWQFPFDKLKIDRAFTSGLADDQRVAVIVNSIVSLAHSLNIRVNAEGVETAQQLELLRRHGCDEMQGFLLGRPAPVDALAHRSERWPTAEAPRAARSDYAPLDTRPMPLPSDVA